MWRTALILLLFAWKETQAMAHPLSTIRTLYIDAPHAETSGFDQRLADAMADLGRFELTNDRAQADAVVTMQSEDADEGFVGQMRISDPRGTTLWSGQAMRPHGESGPMAYERLIDQLQRELG
jgi:hypothetical protein